MHPGGGMTVGPDHPMFGGHGGINPSNPAMPQHRFPPGSIPPGARFDPVSPFGPQSGPAFPGRGNGRGNGRGSNMPFSGDPDNDELMPPGAENMYY